MSARYAAAISALLVRQGELRSVRKEWEQTRGGVRADMNRIFNLHDATGIIVAPLLRLCRVYRILKGMTHYDSERLYPEDD